MSLGLIVLAAAMAAVTYPARALPLLAPGIERLPPRVLDYLRLVGPSVLAALGAVNTVVFVDAARRATFHVGIEWIAVGACVAIIAWRRSLLAGLVVAVLLTAIARAVGAG